MATAPANHDVAAIVAKLENDATGLAALKVLYMQPTRLLRQGRIDLNSQRDVLKTANAMAESIDDDSSFCLQIEKQMQQAVRMRHNAPAPATVSAHTQNANRFSDHHWRRVRQAIVSDVAAGSILGRREEFRIRVSEESAVQDHIRGLLNKLRLPASWAEEGVHHPTEECVKQSLKIMLRLFARYGIIPYKSAASREGGTFAAYRASKNNNILRLDVDNELDAVAVVSDGTSVLCSAFIGHDSDKLDTLFGVCTGSAALGM